MRSIVVGLLALLVVVASAAADEVVLTSGETLQGAVVQRTPERIVLEHAILGPLTIELTDIRTINGREPGPAPEQRGPVGPPPGQPAPPAGETAPPAAPEKPPATWKSALEVGLNASEGTTEDTSVRLALRSQRTSPLHTLRLDAVYRLATQRGDRTENRFSAGVFSERRKENTRWTGFLQSRFDIDEFQSWDERLTVNGGLGYDVVDLRTFDESGTMVERLTVTARTGGGIRREWGSSDDDLNPEGLLGAEFACQLDEHQKLNGTSTYFPDLSSSGDFRVVSSLDWLIAIDRLDGINLKLGLAHEYDSQTDDDISRNDFSAYATLVVNF